MLNKQQVRFGYRSLLAIKISLEGRSYLLFCYSKLLEVLVKLNIFLRLFTMLALVTVFGLTPQAEAANRAGAITLSPMVGAHIFDKNEGFKNSGFIGLNLGYNFTKNWGAELVGTSSRVAKDAVGADDFTYFTGRIDLLYHFRPDERLVPYLAAGIGGALLKHNMPGDTYNQDLLADFGGGIKYFLTDRLALRFDARNVIRHEPGVETPGCPAIVCGQQQQQYPKNPVAHFIIPSSLDKSRISATC